MAFERVDRECGVLVGRDHEAARRLSGLVPEQQAQVVDREQPGVELRESGINSVVYRLRRRLISSGALPPRRARRIK